jgi:hypothetical protein
MVESTVIYDISGLWEGNGTEVRLTRNTNIVDQITLRLVRKAEKVRKNTFKFIDIFYDTEGNINYGPTQYLVDTGGSTSFFYADDYGTGLDYIIIMNIGTNQEYMRYTYNINAISESIDPTFKSLTALYELRKVSLKE